MTWNANLIAGALARQFFQRKHLVVVPQCNWTGHECDLLVVTTDLRVIDVEIKVSRAQPFAVQVGDTFELGGVTWRVCEIAA